MNEIMRSSTYSNREIRGMAEVFKSLGNPVRLKILTHLVKGECCVCELVDISGTGFSTVSRHLSIMKATGLLIDDKRGQQVFYQLAMPCVIGFIDCLLEARNSTDSHTCGYAGCV